MTNFSYNTGVPNAPNNPSIDQPVMLNNTQSIDGILDVDLVGFNADDGGTHKQVTFSSNNVPTLPTPTAGGNNIGILFTNTVGSGTVDQLFYYAGTAAQSSSQYVNSASTNGSTFLLGGIIMKWARTDGTKTVYDLVGDFNVANFPNGAFGAVASIQSGNSGVRVTLTQTQVTVVAGGLPCFVIMLGY